MRGFTPDWRHIANAARNIEAERLPLYEHSVGLEIMETILGKKFSQNLPDGYSGKKEFFRNYCEFFKKMGYDAVIFEQCIGAAMPGAGSLGGHKPGVIQSREDFEKYPWKEVPDLFFQYFSDDFRALGETLPEGMRAVGGPGNGIFECVQEITGYENLCYIKADDPDLYRELFEAVGRTNYAIWERFLAEFGDTFCVMRFGDDLGFKSTTLISDDDIRELVIPQYARIIALVHSYNKPFLLHSCGCIFDVMDDIINVAKIDAKHSNEDQIARFPVWVERYGDRIGNFGGIDTDAVCRLSKPEMREYIRDVLDQCRGHGGIAFSSGNSIPNYVPVEGYLTMIETVREYRGE